jgi:hypothetical protein
MFATKCPEDVTSQAMQQRGLAALAETRDFISRLPSFIVPLKRVAAMLPKERQSLFFSATMPKAIADLGKQFINNPVRVEVSPQAPRPSGSSSSRPSSTRPKSSRC